MKDFKELFKFREDTKDNLTEGGICVAHQIFYGLFKSPYVLWRMACKYLRNIRNEAFLDIEKIDKPLPFITFLLRFIFDFLLQALTYISVLIAPLAAIYMTITGIADANSHDWAYHMSDFLADFVGTFAAFYYAPIALRLVIELLVIVRKYGPVILRYLGYLFLPFIVFFNFLRYLSNKCKYKSEKYEKKSNDLNKE
jgi:hypothetical protein